MTPCPRYAGGALGGDPIVRIAAGFRFAWTRLPPDLRLPRHAHERATLNTVLRGEYAESVLGRQRSHGPMTVIGKPAATEHANRVGQAGATCLVLEVPGVHYLADAFARPAGDIGNLAMQAVRELKAPDSASRLILEGIALEMIGLAGRSEAARERDTSRWLGQILELIHETVRAGAALPHLEKLGRMVGRHPVYVARAFRQRFGRSIGAYARALRIDRARRELAGGTSVAAVAARAGFADQSHFSRVFRHHVGLSPAEFRRQVR